MATFVDRAVLHVAAGDGGNGCASVRREKFKPLGGPDGADGGDGGDVVLVVRANTTTLLDHHHHPHRKATSGKQGQGSMRTGAKGVDLEVPVPSGTVVYDEHGKQLADLVGEGDRFVVAAGGKGGLGNASLASTKRKAPGFALLGEPGEARDVVLELKTRRRRRARRLPERRQVEPDRRAVGGPAEDRRLPVHDPGAEPRRRRGGRRHLHRRRRARPDPRRHAGKGLGLEFLRHVERCAVLVHVLDCATLEPGRDPISDLELIEQELALYKDDVARLTERPRLVVLNKVDVPEARELAELVTPELEARGLRVLLRLGGRAARGCRP